MLSVGDIQDDQNAAKQATISRLRAEIRELNARIGVPANWRGLLAGAGLGHLLGGTVGAIAGGYIGKVIGTRNALSDDDKQILSNLRAQKIEQLKILLGQKDLKKKIAGGVMSAADVAKMDYEAYQFDGDFYDLFGYPARPFHCMVFGRPKQGKSIFSFQFANYLSQFGKVLYIASEEGFGGTLKKKINDFGLGANQNVRFSDAKGIDQMRKFIPGHTFVFIDSVNFAKLDVDDVEALKSEFPGVSFVTIQQATKGGQFRGSQEYAHNCDMIVEVISGVAYQQGRFQAASEYQIFDGPEKKADKKETKEQSDDSIDFKPDDLNEL